MFVSEIKEEDLTVEMIDRLLFQGLEDTGEKADCIIVLGSMKAAKYRVPVAVDAYNAGRAAKLLLCGGKLRDFPHGTCSEAEDMYKAALKLGIPKETMSFIRGVFVILSYCVICCAIKIAFFSCNLLIEQCSTSYFLV